MGGAVNVVFATQLDDDKVDWLKLIFVLFKLQFEIIGIPFELNCC